MSRLQTGLLMHGVNPDLPRLFHHLNNQLGVILANAELLERRLPDEHRARAEQVVSGTLEAIETARRIRQAMSAE